MHTFFARDVTIVGHRGWPTRFPDNSHAGIRAGLSAVAAVEVDVRRTRDGRLVLSHDPSLGGHVVAESSWETLSTVDIGEGHRPVLLDAVLADGPAGRVDLEVKNLPGEPGFEPDHRLALDTAGLARPGDMVSCFFWPSLAAVRRVHPEVATGVLVGPDGDLGQALDEAVRLGHTAILPWWHMVETDPDVVGRARAAGVAVAVWTLDDVPTARRLVERGVRGIITNDPGAMAAGLDGGES